MEFFYVFLWFVVDVFDGGGFDYFVGLVVGGFDVEQVVC